MIDRAANFSKWTLRYGSKGLVDYSQAPLLKLKNSERFYSFENFETVIPWFSFMQANRHIPVVLSLCYILAVFALARWMKDRPAMTLRGPLILWNMSIGIFSLVGFFRSVPDLIHVWKEPDGFYKSLCDP